MSDEQRAWLRLSMARVPAPALATLLAEFGDAVQLLKKAGSDRVRAALGEHAAQRLREVDEAAVDAALAWADAPDNHLLHAAADDYPPLLAEIRDWPSLIYVKGDPDTLHLPGLAIVGSRNPTRGGLDTAEAFAGHLGRCGFTIVSGLAQGIDSAAHRGAIAAGAKTVAVFGHGIDRVYPAANRELAHQVAAQGALVSEYPLGTPPRREHFPARNRLISGLSVGTLVVEAAFRSGSLITARLAAEQGREVFAIPGSIHNPLARGCHRLIRDGARLVENANDILAELQPLIGHLMQHNEEQESAPQTPRTHDPDYERLLQAMGFDPISADEAAAKSGLTIDQVSSMLLILELESEVEVLQGGKYSRLRHSGYGRSKEPLQA